MPEPATRSAVRALLMSPAQRLLMFEFHLPPGHIAAEARVFWGLPGGQIEPGETPEAALRRELAEETGMDDLAIGAEVFHGSNLIQWRGQPTRTRERFFLVRSPDERISAASRTRTERSIIRQHRWWTLDEIAATTETIFPPRLGHWLDRALRQGTAAPWEIPL
jgi:ADP-ribose pyrophosphatase YjhB (NUDIX family)